MDKLYFGTGGVPHSAASRSTAAGIRRIAALGLGCMEIEFVRGVKMSEGGAREVAQAAAETGVKLSVHAPYYINLNAHDPAILEASMGRLLQSCHIGALCGAVSVVVHSAFYLGDPPKEVFDRVKKKYEEAVRQLRREKNNITDKSKRVLESLLATPLSLPEVWFGKSLAVSIPSVVISSVMTVAAVLLMNYIFIIPVVGRFIMPTVTNMITGFFLVPVISLFVTMVVTLFQLILNNPRIANFAFMILFFAVFWIPTTPLLSSLNMPAIYLTLTAVLIVLNVVLSRLLTKERVILSSKG